MIKTTWSLSCHLVYKPGHLPAEFKCCQVCRMLSIFPSAQQGGKTTLQWKKNKRKKLSAVPGGQEVGPDIERLIGHLEEAQDAVGGWAPGVPVPRNNAVLMENLNEETLAVSALPKCEKANFVFTSSESLTKNAWLGNF